MDNWTQDPPEPNTAYRFRYYVPDADRPTGKKLVDNGLTFPTRGDWAGARERSSIERLTKGERIDPSTYPPNHYLDLDAISPA